MLTEIRCEAFGKEFRNISFRKGLNVVLGSSGGGNALGKTTFLWVIDYCFGGEMYCSGESDIKNNVDNHVIYFTFQFNNETYFFYRMTDVRGKVFQCDSKGHLIRELTLRQYRNWLQENYGLDAENLQFQELAEHFFRIYGRGNTHELYPLLSKRRETDEHAIDFLLRLFGHGNLLQDVMRMAEQLGVKGTFDKKSKEKKLPYDDLIKEKQRAIKSLEGRLETLMQVGNNGRYVLLGFDDSTNQKVEKLQTEIQILVKKKNELKSKYNAILSGNEKFCSEVVQQDLESLVAFFPDTNVKALDEIHNFHVKIREILAKEADEAASALKEQIDQCEREIVSLKSRLDNIGYTEEISDRILSQSINISKLLDELKEEKQKLEREKEKEEGFEQARRQMENLVDEMFSAMRSMQKNINNSMESFNTYVTDAQENAPFLGISNEKEIHFGTYGNTSEGTAFKSLILYDLAILKNTRLPVLIHDSNIIKSVSSSHMEHILELYENSGKQVFIVFDRMESASEDVREIMKYAKVISLSEGHELYGKSWTNIKEKRN
jgi:hypothetical protein